MADAVPDVLVLTEPIAPTALINIRPSQENRSMEIEDPDTHRVLFRTLLQLDPVAARQVPLVIAR